jgi:hypothetical protein
MVQTTVCCLLLHNFLTKLRDISNFADAAVERILSILNRASEANVNVDAGVDANPEGIISLVKAAIF